MSKVTNSGTGDTSRLPELSILDGRHRLTVHGLTIHQDSFTIRYTITPPLPGGDDEASILLFLEAEDDLGHTYSDWGGAFGRSPDGTHTDGSITGQPAVAAGAGEIRARITFLRDGEEFPYALTLPLP
ncbi:hypothetical protein [Streptomyces exfoliatus]|uniref:hypothetical protein n=1 Tax=Streptomyces exfoliatus TaxID=1905 RepID=UPI000465F56F|nr:hypothetical protein [Streptomyces exfoliatus]